MTGTGEELPIKVSSLVRRVSFYLMPVLVLTSVWFSLFSHYYVSSPHIANHVIEASRSVPDDALLAELSRFHFFRTGAASQRPANTVALAEQILQGEFPFPGLTPQPTIRLPLDPRQIDQGPPTWQLAQASFIVPRMLLSAYRITGRDDFFLTARDVILAWASYERRAVLPKGFLWNDHAIAERILVLADFWALYRHHPEYEARAAETILLLAVRSGYFLARSAHFTVSTNHGLMQNLALWHLSLAFPLIPQSAHYRQLAYERLREQMGFFINDEGLVLEHSAGYHKAGLHFISMAFRYMSLLHIRIPQEWKDKYEKATDVYRTLRRPDGSLPMLGDTESGHDPHGPVVTHMTPDGLWGPLTHGLDWSPMQAYNSYPVAGYSIWWDGLDRWPSLQGLSQTVITWSHFPGHAHKHADEMSVVLWARGQTWWTNVGYWPYGSPGRRDAESWNGSNAPHLTLESASSLRTTRMLANGAREGLAFIDLERRGPQRFTARRQVLHAQKTLWLVIDHTLGDSMDWTTTLWTTFTNVRMSVGRIPGSYELRGESTEAVLTTFIFGSTRMSTRIYRGSLTPLAGWQILDGTATPTSAIMVEQPTNDSWAAAVWSLNDGRPGTLRLTARPTMLSWEKPEMWTMLLPLESGSIRVSRQGDRILVKDSNVTEPVHLTLARPSGVDEQIIDIQYAHEKALSRYPLYSDQIDYRLKATYLSILILLLQEAFFAAYKRVTDKHYILLRVLSIVAWGVLGTWLVVIKVRLI